MRAYLLLILFLGNSCSKSEDIHEERASMYPMVQNFFQYMQNQYLCQLVGVGGGIKEHPGMEDEIFIYNFQYDLTKDQARYLILSSAQKFIDSVNQTEEYRKNLPGPYSHENLNLIFGFKDATGAMLGNPKLGGLILVKNRLYFLRYIGPFLSPDRGTMEETETLEEALALNEVYLKRVEAGLETLPF